MVWMISSCGHNGLEEYKNALSVTSQIDSGSLKLVVDLELTFNEDGLSAEQSRQLNEFKTMHLEMTNRYGRDENSGSKEVQADMYFSIGGFGVDSTFYMDGKRQAVRLPIINKLMYIDNRGVQNELQEFSLETTATQWTKVFNEEDVIIGQQDYIITEDGQIKTMTYTIKLTSEQLMTLFMPIKQSIEELSQEQIVTLLSIEPEMAEEVKKVLDQTLPELILTNLDGKAYVDFDGRLSRQTLELEGLVMNNRPGQLKSVNMTVQMDTDMLGEDQELAFPDEDDYQWIESEDVEDAYKSVSGL